jgi:hypothetical protein
MLRFSLRHSFASRNQEFVTALSSILHFITA